MFEKLFFVSSLGFIFSSTYYVFLGSRSHDAQVAIINMLGLQAVANYLPSSSKILSLFFPVSFSSFAQKYLPNNNFPDHITNNLYDYALPILYFAICFFFTKWLHDFLFEIADINRPLESTLDIDVHGKLHPKGELRTRKEPGDMPPSYPNGWFKVMESSELKKGQIKNVQAFGQNLVVFRGEDGNCATLDAYCPHLGANLSGGSVKGDCIQCPFHGWSFNGDGKCVDIPYLTDKSIPSFAKTTAWPTREINGMILVWYDAEGREPYWEVPPIPAIQNGSLRLHARAYHEIRVHIQEVPENVADYSHLNFLHIPFMLEKFGIKDLFNHRWEIKWRPGEEPDTHLAYVDIRPYLTFNGWKVPGSELHVKATQVGPGIISLDWQTTLGRFIVLQTPIPMAPMLTAVHHAVYAQWTIPRFYAKITLDGILVQFERDVPIWHNKTFLSKPMLVAGDGPIPQFRRWYANFYSKNSAQPKAIACYKDLLW